jgi:hypothetical protein
MPEERPSDSLLSPPALLLLFACDSHITVLNWSRSLVLRIRRMAAVAPGLVLRILLISPRKSANSSSRMARHVGHLNRTCRTVIAPSSHVQRLLHMPLLAQARSALVQASSTSPQVKVAVGQVGDRNWNWGKKLTFDYGVF